jgi:hypothetical protein
MYHSIPTAKKQREKKRKLITRSVLLFSCVALIGFLIVQFFTQPSFQIKKIEVHGNKILVAEDILKIAQKDLLGEYYYVFPRTNTFIYPKDAIRSEIASAFPRASSVELSLEDNALIISLTERDPAAIWCGFEKNATTTDNTCFYLDKTGYVFDSSPSFSGDAYFTFYGKGLLKEGSPMGHNFISAELFQEVSDMRKLLQKYNKKTTELFLGDEERAELTADSGCKIVFSTDQDIASLRSNLEAVFKSSDWGKDISGKDKCAELEYIDFRFGNKIYYKQKGFEPAPFSNIVNTEIIPAISTSTPIETAIPEAVPATQ